MKNSLLVSTVVFIMTVVHGQQSKVDSPFSPLKPAKEDTNKVNALNGLAREMELSGDYEKGINYAAEAKQLAEKINFKKGTANAYGSFGNLYYQQGNYTKALENYFAALKIDETLNNKHGMARRLGNIGNVYNDQADYPKALDYYFKALKMREELGAKNLIATTLGNIGVVYQEQANYPKALNYYFKALKMDEELGNKNGIARHLGNIGNSYNDQADYPKALDYYFKALKMNEELGNKNYIATILGNIGNVYNSQANYPNALHYYFKALKINEESGNKNYMAANLGNIGSLYTATGKFAEAEKYLKHSLALCDTLGVLDITRQVEQHLSELYDKTGRTKLAFEHYKKYIAARDSIANDGQKKKQMHSEMNFEFEKKEAVLKEQQAKEKGIADEKSRKQKIITYSIASGLFLLIVFAGFVFRSLKITRRQKQVIEVKNKETEAQKHIIEEKNKDITDSIRYAKRIQSAMLKDEEHTTAQLPEHFILYMPKDIISGDFYWGHFFPADGGVWYISAADCTGHGVPGAMMSMLGMAYLNEIVTSGQLSSPAEILDKLSDQIIAEFRQTGQMGEVRDGMDIALARLEMKRLADGTFNIQFSGANNPMYVVSENRLTEIKANNQPIGYWENRKPFTNHEVTLQKGDILYMFSDGFPDQFGGPKGKKFKNKQLKELFTSIHQKPVKEQKAILKKAFEDWKNNQDQVDDVLVIGVRL